MGSSRKGLEQYAREKGSIAEPEALQQIRQESKNLCEKCAEAQKQSLEICRQYRKNTAKIADLEKDILKGLSRGDDLAGLFLKAVQALGLLTGDTAIYQQAQGKISKLYAYGLGQADAVNYEIQQIQSRLEHMENCACDVVTRAELDLAIREQKKLLEQLKNAREQAKNHAMKQK